MFSRFQPVAYLRLFCLFCCLALPWHSALGQDSENTYEYQEGPLAFSFAYSPDWTLLEPPLIEPEANQFKFGFQSPIGTSSILLTLDRIDEVCGVTYPDPDSDSLLFLSCESGPEEILRFFFQLDGLPFDLSEDKFRPFDHPLGRAVQYSDLDQGVMVWKLALANGYFAELFIFDEPDQVSEHEAAAQILLDSLQFSLQTRFEGETSSTPASDGQWTQDLSPYSPSANERIRLLSPGPNGLYALVDDKILVLDLQTGEMLYFLQDERTFAGIMDFATGPDGGLWITNGEPFVTRYDSEGQALAPWRTDGSGIYGAIQIEIDPQGQVYLLEQTPGQARLRIFDPAGEVILEQEIQEAGAFEFNYESFLSRDRMALGPDGLIYVQSADSGVTRAYTVEGELTEGELGREIFAQTPSAYRGEGVYKIEGLTLSREQ